MARVADAVVVGSRIIEQIEAAGRDRAVEAVTGLIRELRVGIDGAR